ncbi:beta strand repeat-containing protein [Methylobacterium sp. HMF5984]|uniref:beta strand repeat-containing protein n=1 Tax=Methylobacterium sp. HMF5984 TaxID=3367370 RepID=UPI0038542AF3
MPSHRPCDRPAARLHRDLLTTTALALALGLAATGSASAQAYNAGTGATSAGANSTAVGPNAAAGGDESFAGGYNASSSGAGSVAIGSGAAAQSATTNQGIINYRDANGVGNPTAGTGGDIRNGANGSTTPPGPGEVNAGAQPSGTAIGKKSTVGAAGGVAVGYNNAAGTGTFNSTAIGANNAASGSYGVAIGYANIATGRSTLSLGTNNQALGDVAIALGRQSYAVGDFSFAQGFIASAYGQDALALGRLSVAGETGSNPTASNIAIGDNSNAVGGSALALGSGASATKARSVALGAGSMALRGSLSGTEAYTTTTLSSANTELSVGAAGAERQITNVAGGQQDTDAVNLRQLRSVGNGVAGNATALGGSFGSDGTYTAPSYSYNGKPYTTVPGVVGAIDQLGLRYDTDGSGNRLAGIDLTRGGSVGSAVGITGLAPATTDSGAVALSQMPLRYSTSADPTTANPATPSNDATLVGANGGAPVALHNVAPGSLASGSTDAVNGGQLFTTNQAVATNAGNLTALRSGLDAGTIGLVQQDAASRTITVGSATDGSVVDFTGTAGARRLTGLAAGSADGDAATVGQLRLGGNAVMQIFGAGAAFNPVTGAFTAPAYAVGGQTYGDVGSALAATNRLAVQYVPDGANNPTGVVDLARGNGGNAVALRGVSAGRLAAGSTDAVNGDQLYATNLRVATNTSDIATNAGAIGTLRQGITDGTIGLVQQDPTSRAILVAAATDGALVDFRNSAGNGRVLRGVSAGAVAAGSDEAVNGSQLYDTNQAVAANGAQTSTLQSAIGAGTIGLVQQDPTTRDIAVGAGTDGTRLTLRNASGGTRLLTGLSDGTIAAGSADAVTGGQLYDTNQAVAANASGLAATNGNLASLQSGIVQGTIGLLRQDQASRELSIGAATDGTVLNLANAGGTGRTVAGVAAGTLSAASNEAVNGSQLYATNQAVAGLSAGVANGTVGLVQQDQATRGLTVGANTDGTTVSFADRNGTARTLTGIAGGRIAAGSTEAVDGGQVYGLSASLAKSLGGGAGVAADGSVTAPSYAIQGSRFGDVGSALGSLDAAVTNLNTVGSRYVAVRSTGAAAQATGADSVAIGPASVASAAGGVALGANAVARRAGLSGAAEAFSGAAVASTAGAVSVGAEGAERQIVNVAGGTQDTDAVNLRQLRAVGGNLAGALGGGAGFAADGSFTGPTYAIGGKAYSGVGDALAAVDTFAVKYDVDPATGGRGQSLTLAGSDPNQPVLIRNVAAGVLATDAANLGQVTGQVATAKAQSFAYTDQRVQASYAASTAYTDARVAPLEKQMTAFGSQLAGLQNEVGQVRQEARRGAAIGLAAASLRFDDRPGKLSMAAGGGVWRGEGAASMGIGYTLPDGSARVNATGVAAGRDFGIGAGASFTLN